MTLQLYVNGTLSQTLAASTGSVAAVRLGSVTSGGSSTVQYFDAFASKRSVSPLGVAARRTLVPGQQIGRTLGDTGAPS